MEPWKPIIIEETVSANGYMLRSIFLDFDVDVEYAIVMSYRLATDDHMFSQMRE